jgi:hypothetical protein
MEAKTVKEPMVELHDIYCSCEACHKQRELEKGRRDAEKVLRETK